MLLAAIFGFLPGDDERLRATVDAIADELTENGFVLRYRTDETDDGLSGKEGTFLICSFWLVSALAIVGELQQARDLMERLLRDRLAARPLRGGVRRRHRPPPRQLPAGVLAPRADGGGRADHRPRAARRSTERPREEDGGSNERRHRRTETIRSTIPARLDRLSWSPFHTRMVCGLGAAWILDGLQITIASSVTGVLIQPDTLDMTLDRRSG